ncbi:MAG: hypothetical protein KBS83_00045 [Lachnospiraceae bacterium]|nr:hypothetical protein [Candidatus Equihabitans merdae]
MELINQLIIIFGGRPLDLSTLGTPGIIVSLVVALVMCFFGYTLLRVFVAIMGGVMGIFLGSVIAEKASLNNTMTMIVIVIFAVGICLISFFVYRVGVFLLSFFIGFALLTMIAVVFTASNTAIIIGLVAGVIMGTISCLLIRPMTIGTTGIGGGMVVAFQVIQRLIGMGSNTGYILTLLLGILIGVLGIIVQLKLTKGKKRRR